MVTLLSGLHPSKKKSGLQSKTPSLSADVHSFVFKAGNIVGKMKIIVKK